jgi:hypothetical protein
MQMPSNQKPKVACFVTSFTEWDGDRVFSLDRLFTSQGVRIEKLGQIRKLLAKYVDRETRKENLAVFYAYLDNQSKILLCFTLERSEVIKDTIGRIGEAEPGIYSLFISPRTFEFLMKAILEEYPFAKCIHFIAKYQPEYAMKSETRPEIRKTVIYHGEDGLKTLEELKTHYGVRPRSMRFKIPDIGTYEIGHDGCFTLWATNNTGVKPRQVLLKLLNTTLKDALISRKVIETANYEIIPVKTREKTFEIPRLTPWIINFSREIRFEDSKAFLGVLAKSGFTLFNHNKVEGSLRLSGMIIDHQKNSVFTFDMNNQIMTIAPHGAVPFDSFLRFYQTLVEDFDPDASCAELKEE